MIVGYIGRDPIGNDDVHRSASKTGFSPIHSKLNPTESGEL